MYLVPSRRGLSGRLGNNAAAYRRPHWRLGAITNISPAMYNAITAPSDIFVRGVVTPGGISRSIGPILSPGTVQQILNPQGQAPYTPSVPATTPPATSTTTTTPAATTPTTYPEPTAQPPIGYEWAQNADGTWYLSPAQAGYPTLPTTPASAITTGTQSANTGYIVPTGYPTGQPYIDSQGNTWEYNPNTNNWYVATTAAEAQTAAAAQESQLLATTGSSVGSSAVPAGTPTTSTYTDSSGNVWGYNTQTGQWQIVGTAQPSEYQSVLNWLSESTLIAGVPNWVLAGGGAAVLLWIANPRGRR